MLNEFLNIYESGLKDGQHSLTQTEAIHRIVEKINLLINHFNLLEYNTNEAIKDFSDKVEYYLNNGMIEEVSNKLDEFSEDGTLATIINEQIFNDINKEIRDIKSDINKVNAIKYDGYEEDVKELYDIAKSFVEETAPKVNGAKVSLEESKIPELYRKM